MAKRSNGEGTIRQRENGSWEARFSYRDSEDRVHRKSLYRRTKTEARAAMREALARVESDLPPVDANISMSDWVDQWSSTILRASDRKETTKVLYRGLAASHVKPEPFGGMSLAAIKPRHIDALVARLREEKGLADSTVRNVYTVVRTILDGAKRDGLIAQNAAESVPRPSVAKHEAKHLTPAEVRAILDAATTSRHHAVLTLVAVTGLRRGEALALHWDDIELDKGMLHVRRTIGRVNGALVSTSPKTENSRRDVAVGAATVALLRRHRAAQSAERLRAGSQWANLGLAFTTESGSAVDPRNLLRAFTVAAAKADIPGVGLHTLRHSAATTLLDSGVPLHAVSRILGHSSVSITGDIYGHVVDSTQRTAMESLTSALGI